MTSSTRTHAVRIGRCTALLLALALLVTLPAAARVWEGTLDHSFDPGAGTTDDEGYDAPVLAIALQPVEIGRLTIDRLLVAGAFEEYRGVSRRGISRVHLDGRLDTSFDPGSGLDDGAYIACIVVLPNHQILIGGNFQTYNGVARPYVARLNANGSLDTTFDATSAISGAVLAMTVQPDGKILVGGEFTTDSGGQRNYVARLNANGSLDTSFNPGTGPNERVHSIAYLPDGKVLIGGYFTSVSGQARAHLARLNANGTVDTTYAPASIEYQYAIVYAIVPLPDGKVVIGGSFETVGGVARGALARLNSNGSLDTSFDPGDGGNDAVHCVVIDRRGRLLIAGAFTSFGDVVRYHLARVNPDGSLDTTFDPGEGPDWLLWDMVLQPDGRILIGGEMTAYDGTPRHGVARVNGYATDVFIPAALRLY